MKYPQLTGICKTAIEKNLCLGCGRLENPYFTGVKECKYVTTAQDAINFSKKILKGEQVKI